MRTFSEYVLRGYTFILFWNHPVAGALLCLALFFLNPWAGAVALVANVVATAVAVFALRLEPAQLRYGLFGANGMFVGLAWAAFLPESLALLVFPLALTAVGAILTYFLIAQISLRLNLPVLVVPFVLVGWMLAPLCHGLPAPHLWNTLYVPAWWQGAEIGARAWLPDILSGFFRGLSQIPFADSLLLGVGIFAVWLARALIPAIAALAGFLASWLVLALFGGAIHPDLRTWAAINGALTALCLAGIFVRPTVSSFVYAMIGAVGSAWLTTLIIPVFARLHLPIFATPFLVVTLLLLLVLRLPVINARKLGLVRIPLTEVGAPVGSRGIRNK